MTLEEIIGILEKEAEKCQGWADNWRTRKDKDEDVMMYWIGKRRGILDAVKYIKRLEAEE